MFCASLLSEDNSVTNTSVDPVRRMRSGFIHFSFRFKILWSAVASSPNVFRDGIPKSGFAWRVQSLSSCKFHDQGRFGRARTHGDLLFDQERLALFLPSTLAPHRLAPKEVLFTQCGISSLLFWLEVVS